MAADQYGFIRTIRLPNNRHLRLLKASGAFNKTPNWLINAAVEAYLAKLETGEIQIQNSSQCPIGQ